MLHYCNPSRVFLVLVWSVILAFEFGCAAAPRVKWPPVGTAREFGTVAVIPAQAPPGSNFYVFAEGALAGAGKSAVSGGTAALALGGAGAIISTALVPWAAPVWVIMWGVTATAGATAVIVEGSVRGSDMPPEKAQQIRAIMAEAVARLDSQELLGIELSKAIQTGKLVPLKTVEAAAYRSPEGKVDYSKLRAAGVDTALETRITEMGFVGCGKGFDLRHCWDGSDNPLIFLFLKGEQQLVRTADETIIEKSGFDYESAPHEFKDWVENKAQLLADELELAYRDIAGNINDNLFLLTPFEIPVPSLWYPPGHQLWMVCWLTPISPENEYRIGSLEGQREIWKATSKAFPSPWPEPPLLSAMWFSPVGSLYPELRWSAFPRDFDREQLDKPVLESISDVTYDMKIWEAVRGSRGRLVYERQGLKEPQHRLEQPLKPDSRYLWSFRARFRYEGRLMATRWALFRPPSLDCNADPIPVNSYFRFRTPN